MLSGQAEDSLRTAIDGHTGPTRRRRPGLATVLALLALLAPAAPTRADRVFDPEAPPETRYRLTPTLSFGADLELDYAFRRNLDLDDRRRDGLALLTPELSLAWSFDPTPTVQGFLNLALARTVVVTDRAGQRRRSEEDVTVEIKEAYLRVGRLTGGPSAQLGRQRFDDERKWLYDEDLEAARFRYLGEAVALELSVSRNGLVRSRWGGPDERERITNYILHGRYTPRSWLELEAYAIVRDDQSAEPQTPVFLGVRSRGEPLPDLDYWLELGVVGGRDGSRRLRGWGTDVGATYEWQVRWRPSVTLGVAFGSGDRDPDDARDGRFRQTGLQRNEADFGGSTDFKYYGEILDPELSNLLILTAGVGLRPSERWSVDLVYHYVEQHRASTSLGGTALGVEATGRSRRLGSEIDLVVGVVDILDRIEVKAVLGYFFPGPALAGRGGAWGGSLEAQLRF